MIEKSVGEGVAVEVIGGLGCCGYGVGNFSL